MKSSRTLDFMFAILFTCVTSSWSHGSLNRFVPADSCRSHTGNYLPFRHSCLYDSRWQQVKSGDKFSKKNETEVSPFRRLLSKWTPKRSTNSWRMLWLYISIRMHPEEHRRKHDRGKSGPDLKGYPRSSFSWSTTTSKSSCEKSHQLQRHLPNRDSL